MHNSRDVRLLHFTHRALFPQVIRLTCQLDIDTTARVDHHLNDVNDLDFNTRTLALVRE